MRKTIAGLIVLSLCLGLLAASRAAQQPSVAALQPLVGPFFSQLATLRGLPSPGSPPPVVVRSRSETRRFIDQELSRKYPAARVEAERKAMVAWGLIPADFDLRAFFVDLLEEQAAAYYDPIGKVMVLADWLPPEQQQAALLHELVHALQDRDVSLDQFIAPVPGQGDHQLARQALVEGEAVALSLAVLLKAQGLELKQIPDLSGVQQLMQVYSAGTVFNRAPRFIQDLLLFPYTQGLVFVHQFTLRQPWSAVSQLYRDPPRSTAQILHPAKLFDRRQDPIPVALPDLRPALPSAWRPVEEDELGEWALGEVLLGFLGDATARRLVSGWRGDRYHVWEGGGGLGLVYRVAWETEEGAEAFARTYAGFLETKYPSLRGKGTKSPGPIWGWQEGAGRFLIEQRGTDVLVLERIPVTAAEPIRQAVWAR